MHQSQGWSTELKATGLDAHAFSVDAVRKPKFRTV